MTKRDTRQYTLSLMDLMCICSYGIKVQTHFHFHFNESDMYFSSLLHITHLLQIQNTCVIRADPR